MRILIQSLLDEQGILSEDICYCGSWNKYRECCKNSIHTSRIPKDEIQKIKNIVQKSWDSPESYGKKTLTLNKECLLCGKPAISSHTLSKSWMKKIFSSNFVSIPNYQKWSIAMKKIPIKHASTFLWWCTQHDWSIFREIDQNIDINSNYHLNLLAYRAISREYRIKENLLRELYSFLYHWDIVCNTKESYQKTLALLLSTYRWVRDMLVFMLYVYNGIQIRSRRGLRNRFFPLGKISPVLLSSVITPKIPKNWTKKVLNNSTLTIYTDENSNGYCILSYKNSDKDSQKLYKMMKKKGNNLIAFLNELVSKNCENIVCDIKREWEVVAVADGNTPNFPYDTPTFDYIKPLSTIDKS